MAEWAIEWHDPEFVVGPRLRTPGDGANGDLEAFVRVALARQLHQQHASLATDTVVAYVLEPAIETLVEGKPLSEEGRDRVVDAIRAELALLPETTRTPHLLTTARARSGLVEAISDEFPRQRVLAFEELVPRANVQPVARISLTT